uniref:Kinesin light chain n=1 Tax=Mucochytrium quahogii TaxID=96639 RepID=A0A7S2SG07_9STRA|mmetsp:Transcript_13982/g.22847  ORF Transcript_13982/g.22847 Transcript_13982/m.22847 type:complete len:357 (-) Transcript_13982:914-1984(-)|eukprot:CAMPEP_0203745904 /NCGR_PEP_ID=MMETSP0098-20131031/1502_1 /ASSEMBLY_ACC=CAM_ASM_000208 /TAXON_ID=96639 /ORGANISM=" , Strain NY0313808BC1" /LENGTH=356 /DNA_ID=CAMNT_0050633817 /DNA_START=1225 /DNA_END=2295 /DNA_ORIENTATION=+
MLGRLGAALLGRGGRSLAPRCVGANGFVAGVGDVDWHRDDELRAFRGMKRGFCDKVGSKKHGFLEIGHTEVPKDEDAVSFRVDLDDLEAEKEIRSIQEEVHDLWKKGDVGEAKGKAVLSMEMIRHYYGRANPIYASAVNNLGIMNKAQGKYMDAVDLFAEAISLYKDTVDRKHPSYHITLNNLGVCYKELATTELKGVEKANCLKSAKEVLTEACKLQKENLGANDATYGVTLQYLGGVCRDLGESKEGGQLIDKGMKIIRKGVKGDDPRLATALMNWGYHVKFTGNATTAIQLYEEALEIQNKVYHPAHQERLKLLNNLAEAYHENGNEDRANGIRREILSLMGVTEEDLKEQQT